MAPAFSKGDKLKHLGNKVDKPKPEPIKPENLPSHFKIGSTTTTVWAIKANDIIMHHEPVRAQFGKETYEDSLVRLRNLAIALNGELGQMKLVCSYTPIEFMAVEDYRDEG